MKKNPGPAALLGLAVRDGRNPLCETVTRGTSLGSHFPVSSASFEDASGRPVYVYRHRKKPLVRRNINERITNLHQHLKSIGDQIASPSWGRRWSHQ